MQKMAKLEQKKLLKKLIMERLVSHPIERGGVMWAAFEQENLVKILNVSSRTIREWTKQHPFQREIALINGKTCTLFRLLTDDEKPFKTPQYIANIMRKIWKEKIGTTVNEKHHGCLIGLAKEWPENHQIDIFKFVISNWPEFTAAALHYLSYAADNYKVNIEDIVGNDGKPAIRKMNFPSIFHMRIYADVAPPLYVMHLQEKNGVEPDKIPADLMEIYVDAEWI